MAEQIVRIATRKSPLALWQAEHVRAVLQQAHPGLVVELLEMSTQGDKILDTPLAKIGGKGLFVKELERAMLDGEADIAVHSMKDVPVDLPDGLYLPVILEREDPLDAFVSNHYAAFSDLPEGAIVGTSSLRRQCQLRERRPDLDIRDLRGNVNTRLKKLDDGENDAIILQERLFKNLEIHNTHEDRPYCLSISMGVTTYQSPNAYTVNVLMSHADKLMYEHKKTRKTVTRDTHPERHSKKADR